MERCAEELKTASRTYDGPQIIYPGKSDDTSFKLVKHSDGIVKGLDKAEEANANFVLLILHEHNVEMYSKFKALSDLRYDIHCQCITWEKLRFKKALPQVLPTSFLNPI